MPSDEPLLAVWARGGRRTELGPGSLDALRMVEPGRAIALIRADGRRESWMVRGVAVSDLPERVDSIEVDDTARTLTLTICGGPYDPRTEGYLRSLVLRCVPMEQPAVAI